MLSIKIAIHEALRDRADLAPPLDRDLGPAGGDLRRERRAPRSTLICSWSRMRRASWFVKAEGHAPAPACI
jgi:hypothetical protein